MTLYFPGSDDVFYAGQLRFRKGSYVINNACKEKQKNSRYNRVEDFCEIEINWKKARRDFKKTSVTGF